MAHEWWSWDLIPGLKIQKCRKRGAARAARPGLLILKGGWEVGKTVGSDWKLLPPWHPLNSQPASPSQLLEVSKGGRERSASLGLARTLPSAFSILSPSPALDSTPHMVLLRAILNWSAFTSPPESLSRAWRRGLQGSLHSPIDLYRLLLAAAPRWLYFKAGAARLLQVSEAAGTLAEASGRKGC